LVINKRDLAPMVGANLAVMEADAAVQRGERSTIVTSLREEPGAPEIVAFLRQRLAAWPDLVAAGHAH
jgi:urease accessory protein